MRSESLPAHARGHSLTIAAMATVDSSSSRPVRLTTSELLESSLPSARPSARRPFTSVRHLSPSWHPLTRTAIDIDVLDPSAAPATGTPETGGWSTRELRTIIRGLEGLHIVGADVVEVAPAYDTNAEVTQIAAADVLFEVLSLMVLKGPLIAA